MTKGLKKILSVLLCATLLFGVTPLKMIYAEDVPTSGTCGESLTWKYDVNTATLTISGMGAMVNYSANPYVGTISPWESHCQTMQIVVIENGVTSIGDCAFYNCANLASVSIGNDVASIGHGAFLNCTSLTNIAIPDSTTSIGDQAFDRCTGLMSITIPSSVTRIGNYAFASCSGLTSISVEIGNAKYRSSSNCLIETASKTLVLGCKTSVIPTDGSVMRIDINAFFECVGLTSISIPNSVTSIGENAFCNCSGLTSITIPESVTNIEEHAFDGCSGLTSISVCVGNTKYYSSGNCLIEISSQTLVFGCNNSIIPHDKNITSIGDRAFYNCAGLTNVSIPDSVTRIGDSAFSGCTGLTSITIPESVTIIDNSAFFNCTGLTSLTIGNNVTSIGFTAFWGCIGLTSVTIPDSVMSIDDNAFAGVKIVVYNGTASGAPWGARALNGYVEFPLVYANSTKATLLVCLSDGQGEIIIPDSVTKIGYSTFSDCTELTNIAIPDSVIDIGDFAFYRCTGLKSMTIPDSVTSIGNYAFYGCTELMSVTIPDSVASIGNYSFYGCSSDLYFLGHPDSYAEAYANENDIAFVSNVMFNLIYNANGGKSAPMFQSGRGTITLAREEPIRDGYVFKYWNTQADGKGTNYAPGASIDLTENTTLYAVWGNLPAQPKVKAVSLNNTIVNYKAKTTLKPTVTADEGVTYTVSYSSSNPNVASVDANGTVTGAKKGSATITCTVTDEFGNTVSDTCKVTVNYTALQWVIKILLFGWIWY